jgi:hypothetical protein
MAKSNVKKVSAEFSKEDHELMTVLAEQNGISVSEWVQRAVAQSIPKDLRARVKDTSIEQKVEKYMEAAEVPAYPSLPLPPEAVAMTEAAFGRPMADPYADVVQLRLKERALEIKAEGVLTSDPHACIYLSKEGNQHFRPGECEGICKHSSQRGRVCFWPSATARNCKEFEARREHMR